MKDKQTLQITKMISKARSIKQTFFSDIVVRQSLFIGVIALKSFLF